MRAIVGGDGLGVALETVLRDVEAQGPFDEVIVAGDLCMVGPAPRQVLDLLRAHTFTVLRGNSDADVAGAGQRGWASAAERYVIDQIGPDGVAYLGELPFSRRITPQGGESPRDDLLVVHANPHNLVDKFLPEMNDRALREVKGDVTAAAIAFGHHHVSYIRQLNDALLVDVSAVGNPKDGDLRCTYGILTWDAEARRWQAELRKLPYPLDETEAQVVASALPDPDKVFRKLLRASY